MKESDIIRNIMIGDVKIVKLSKEDMIKIRQELEEKTNKKFREFDRVKRHICDKVFD